METTNQESSVTRSPAEFLREHADNMQSHVMFKHLPFYRWMQEQQEPPTRFAEALIKYYDGHQIRGCFDEAEITAYKHIYEAFWYSRHRANEST